MLSPTTEGRTYENYVIEHLLTPLGLPFTNPVIIHGFRVDLGLTGTPVVIECKNRLDSHQSHRASAVAWALQHVGWRGTYIVVGPALPSEDTTDRTVLDCAITSGAVAHVLTTGTDPTYARMELAAIMERNRACAI